MKNDCAYNEQDILARVAKSDQRAFELLVEHHTAVIYSHVLTYIKNAPRAEEITQDIFMKIWKHREELPSVVNFRGYLHVITRNTTISALREKIRTGVESKDELDTGSLNPAGSLELRELAETLQQGIALLPPRRKQVFMLSRIEGLSYEEIAGRLGISKSAVNQHIVEALLFLRTYLRDRMIIAVVVGISSRPVISLFHIS